MAAGDWLLGCIPLQETDTGLFNRAYYLSGSYGLWRPVLTVGLGAIGGFLYYFVVKALNADIDEKYGDMQAFVQKLRNMGYERVELIDTTTGKFMTSKEAKRLMLYGSTLLVGKK